MSLAVFALVVGVLGLGLDVWARSSPGGRTPVIDARKHPVLTRVAFFSVLVILTLVLVQPIFSDPQWSLRRDLLTILISVLLLVSFNLLITFVRYLRTRTHHSASN
jgi:hypothetical protein